MLRFQYRVTVSMAEQGQYHWRTARTPIRRSACLSSYRPHRRNLVIP